MPDMTIPATDGSGAFNAYVAVPAKTPAAAVMAIQEIFGVNADMRAKCDAFAANGYIAVSPDLFWRQEPDVRLTDKSKAEWDKAFALMNGFNIDKGIEDLIATLDHVRAMPECTGKVGAVGYCLGGKLAYLMAARSNVDAAVGYYGVGLDGMLDQKIKSPLMLHIAEKDKFSTPEKNSKIIDHFKGSDKVVTHLYPGVDHAFARKDGEHFDAAAAKLANRRTDEYFAGKLKG